jgi:hypothetical protein
MSNADRATSKTTLKRLAPYLVAALALGWVLLHTDLKQLLAAVRHAPLALFIAISTVLLVLNWMADTFAMTSVFGWFGCRVRYSELLIVRGSTYLLAILNYHIGQAAIVGYLYRVCKVPFLRATGWILFIIGINVGTLFLLASAGASTATGELRLLRLVPIACAVGTVVYGALLLAKPRLLAERRLFAPLFEMGIVGHIKGVLVRLPHIGVLLVWQFVCLRLFGVAVSPLGALLYLPAYFAISVMPVNVNGLGVAQLVAVAFFAPYAPVPPGVADVAAAQKATVMAWSLSMQGFSIVHQLLLGFICLRVAGARGLLVEPAPAAAEEEAPASSAAAR